MPTVMEGHLSETDGFVRRRTIFSALSAFAEAVKRLGHHDEMAEAGRFRNGMSGLDGRAGSKKDVGYPQKTDRAKKTKKTFQIELWRRHSFKWQIKPYRPTSGKAA